MLKLPAPVVAEASITDWAAWLLGLDFSVTRESSIGALSKLLCATDSLGDVSLVIVTKGAGVCERSACGGAIGSGSGMDTAKVMSFAGPWLPAKSVTEFARIANE